MQQEGEMTGNVELCGRSGMAYELGKGIVERMLCGSSGKSGEGVVQTGRRSDERDGGGPIRASGRTVPRLFCTRLPHAAQLADALHSIVGVVRGGF